MNLNSNSQAVKSAKENKMDNENSFAKHEQDKATEKVLPTEASNNAGAQLKEKEMKNYKPEAKKTMRTLEKLTYEIGVLESSDSESLRPLVDHMKENDVKESFGYLLLQSHGHRDCDGNWSENLLRRGYITPRSYVSIDPNSGLEIRHKNEFAGPHPNAHEFFRTFFKEAQL